MLGSRGAGLRARMARDVRGPHPCIVGLRGAHRPAGARARQHRGAAARSFRAHAGRALERQGTHAGGARVSVLDRLKQLLEREFSIPASKLDADATLESLDVDSLRLIEIVFAVEDEF